MKGFIIKAWNGEAKVRWVLFFLVIYFLFRIFYIALAFYGHNLHTEQSAIRRDLLLYFIIASPYGIWVHVALWRCSKKLLVEPLSSNSFKNMNFVTVRVLFFLSLFSMFTDVVKL